MSASQAPLTRPTVRQSVALVWRTLRSMRTALILLLLIAVASIGGSLLPQVPNSPERVADYLVAHPFWGEVFWRAGLFDVFGSWWFTLLTVLLFTSLVACLIPRSRAMVRAIGQRPIQAREIDTFRHYAERTVPMPPRDAAEAVERVLRRRLFRTTREGTAVAAEKGVMRELGSLVFHWAFVLLLIGVVVGKGTGYSGRATVAEGDVWTDAALNYDPGSLRPGRLFDGGHSGAGLRLVRYEDEFSETGMPREFLSTVELLDPDGRVVRTQEIRVNQPAKFEGLHIFQFGFGWAPVLEVEHEGTAIADGPLIVGQERSPEGVSQLAMPWLGFVKLPSLEPQVAVELELWPDGRAFFSEGQPMVTEFQPLIRYTVWEGRLVDPSLRGLDTRFMEEKASGVIAGGWTVDLERGCLVSGPPGEVLTGASAACPGDGTPGLTMTFSDLVRYSVFQVSRDVGVPIVLVAAILIVLGLLPALYTARRKLWVRAEPGPDGTTLSVGGFALQRKPQFEEEFEAIVDALVQATGGPARPEREMVEA
jgi:cytochrome c biogenesis protein